MVDSASTNLLSLLCFSCGRAHDPSRLQSVCNECARPLRVDLAIPDNSILDVDGSVDSMWRYHRVLPVPIEKAVSIGEGWTPLHRLDERTYVKDESGNPSGSFKDRGMSMAVSAVLALGVERLVAPSAGNAAVALSLYGRQAGIQVVVAMPGDTPASIVERCRGLDAQVHLVEGDISVAGRWLAQRKESGDFDVSTLKEPFRVEGKKTMGYEIFEQFGGDMPEVVIYPTGGGTGLVGMWKAWDEMEKMGWIGTNRPRLVSVQSAGCAPVVAAYQRGDEDITPWANPVTTAWGLRVPAPLGGFLCLRAIRETYGAALAIDEETIHEETRLATESSGIDFCPEGGAAWAAMRELRDAGEIGEDDRVLVWNTGAGASYR